MSAGQCSVPTYGISQYIMTTFGLPRQLVHATGLILSLEAGLSPLNYHSYVKCWTVNAFRKDGRHGWKKAGKDSTTTGLYPHPQR